MSGSALPRLGARRIRITGAVLAALLAIVALVPAAGATAAGGAALLCDQSSVYGIDKSGAVKRIDATSGAVQDETTLSVTDAGTTVTASNALGIVLGGGAAYAVQERGARILRYDPAGGAPAVVGTVPTSGGQTVIRGAYDPANRIFYTASNGSTATVTAYDVANTREIGVVGTISGLSGNSGDFAFSTSGRLFVVAGDEVRRVDQTEMPTAAGSAALTTTLVTALPAGTSSPGIAFSADGYLYVASSAQRTSGAQLFKIVPATGAIATTIDLGDTSYIPRDLASCNYANTLSGTTGVTERVHDGDQFSVTLTGGGLQRANAATTSGTDTSATAGPVPVLAQETYTATQSATGDTDPNQYDTTYRCIDATSGTVVQQDTGAVATFVYPTAHGAQGRGTDVTCTFTNTPKRVRLTVSSGLDGSRVDAADQFLVAVRDAADVAFTPTGDPVTRGSDATVEPGSGSTGTISVIVGREYHLTQAMASGAKSDYRQYAKTIVCSDSGSSGTTMPSGSFTGTTTITPKVGADIRCVVTATQAPASIVVTTTLGERRVDDGDQFTAAIHDGGATDPVVGSGTATTAGTGATIASGTGTTEYDAATGGRTYTIAHTTSPASEDPRYTRAVTCTDLNHIQADSAPTMTDGRFSVTPVPGARLACEVRVGAQGSGLQVRTALADPRFAAGDQFTATVAPKGGAAASSATTSGADGTVAGGQTATVSTTRDTVYTIGDTADHHADRYEQALTCEDQNGFQRGLPRDTPFTGSFDLTPEPGADLVCTVTFAAKRAVIAGTAELGSERFADGDQFRVELQQRTTTLAQGITAGSGSAVTGGSTGDLAVRRGDVYTILGGPTLHPERYDRTIRCEDATGLQTTGLPNGAFSGSTSFTPDAGTRIACAVTSTLKPPALTATAALADPRADDADQWTVAWRTGGPSGAVLPGGARATTTGTGRAVDPGTGASGPIVATHGVAYTLTESTSGVPARYATTLACEDVNRLQHGLPSGVAFTGAATVVPEAGADVRCTLTTALAPAALALHLTGPASAQVEQTAT